MNDDDAPSAGRRPSRPKGPTPDDEPTAELARAAREAVRQPPDPRLEAQFAHLALWGEPEPMRTAAREPTGSLDPGTDAAQLREAVEALHATSASIERRLDVVIRLLVVLAVALLVLVTALVIRGSG